MAIVFIQALPLEWYSQSDFTNLHFFLIKRHMVMSTVNICTYGVPQWSWVCFCIKRHNIIKFVVCLCWMFKFVIYVFKCSICAIKSFFLWWKYKCKDSHFPLIVYTNKCFDEVHLFALLSLYCTNIYKNWRINSIRNLISLMFFLSVVTEKGLCIH